MSTPRGQPPKNKALVVRLDERRKQRDDLRKVERERKRLAQLAKFANRKAERVADAEDWIASLRNRKKP